MAGLSWWVKITDFGSGPARKISSSVDKMTSSLVKADKAAKVLGGAQSSSLRAMNRTPIAYQSSARSVSAFGRALALVGRVGGPGAVDATMSMAQGLVTVDNALGKVGTSLGGVAKAGAFGFVGAIAAVGAAIAAVTAGLVYFGIKATSAFAKAAVEAYSFRERTLVGMEVMLKSGPAAAELYGKALKFAYKSPLDTMETVAGFQKLLARGFKTNDLERVMTAVSDMTVVTGGSSANAELIIQAIGQMNSKSKMSMEELNQQLADQNLPVAKVMETLAKMKGITGPKAAEKAEEAVKAGKISGKEGVEAVLKTIEAEFGGASAKLMPTLQGLWNQLAGTSALFWNKAFEDTGGGMSKFMDKLKSGMKAFAGVFATENGDLTATGDRVVAIVNRIGKAWTDLIGNMDQKSMGDSINKALTIVERVLPLIESFGAGFKKGLLAGLGPVLKAFDGIDGKKATDIEKTAKAFGMLGEALGWVAGSTGTATMYLAQLLGWVGQLGAWVGGLTSSMYSGASAAVLFVLSLTDGFMQINAFVLSLPGQMFSAGIDLVMGLANGIRAGIGMAVSAATEMANAVLNATRVAHDSHSPSRKFHELGMFAGEGLAGGMDDSAPRVKSSVYDMVTPPTPRQLPAAGMSSRSSGDGASSGGKSVVFHLGSNAIVINGTGDRAEIKSGILEAFEEIALEFGH